MIPSLRNPRCLALNSFIITRLLKPPLLLNNPSRSTQTLESQSPNPSSDLATPISTLLSQGATNWDTLTAQFPLIQLTDALVERVLLNLKDPTNAPNALTFFHWTTQNQKFQHGLRSYCVIIHILIRAGLLRDAQALLESAINKNPSLLVVETILSTYELALPGPRVFDLLVQTYSKMRMVNVAFDACCYLGDHGFDLSIVSFNGMLRVAQKVGEGELAWKVYEYMIDRRVYPNQKTVEVMIDIMCKEGSLTKMIDVLDRIHGGKRKCGPAVIVNMSLALRIFDDTRIEKGVLLLKRLLQKNLILDDVMNSLIMYGYCKIGKFVWAYEYYDDMVKRGFSSNAFVHTAFVGAYCKVGKIEEAVRLMEEMMSFGLRPYDETYNFLVRGCCRLGKLDYSLDFCEKMLKKGFLPDSSACKEIMGLLSEAGQVEKANEMLTNLIDKGFGPTVEIYTKLMDGYGKTGKAQEVLKLYYEIEYKGFVFGTAVYASLVRNLCACGQLKEAEKFLSIIESKSVTPNGCVYDAMIEGYCKKGDIERALYFYDEMVRKNLQPCAHAFMMLVRCMIEINTLKCTVQC